MHARYSKGGFFQGETGTPDGETRGRRYQRALDNLAGSAQDFADKTGAAADGDQVVMDFIGSIDGVAFDGGTGTDYPLVLGSNSFIPGLKPSLLA